MGRQPRRWTTLPAIALALAVVPGTASAHEVTASRFDAPLPLSLLLVGTGATVALTALWLGFTEQTNDATSIRTQTLLTVPSPFAVSLRHGLRVGFLLVVAAGVAGFLGPQVRAANAATVFT